jgi:hypothetical protein
MLPLRLIVQRRRVDANIGREMRRRIAAAGGPDAFERGVRAAELVRLAQDEALSAWAARQAEYRGGR